MCAIYITILILKTLYTHTHTHIYIYIVVQSLSTVWLLMTPWTIAHQASLFFTVSWSLVILMSIEEVMPSNHLILCYPLLLLPSVFLSINQDLFQRVGCWHQVAKLCICMCVYIYIHTLKFIFSLQIPRIYYSTWSEKHPQLTKL